MAFDEKIAKAVKDKYGVDVNGAGKWWECEALWKDPEFAGYFGSVYDDNAVTYVKRIYDIDLKAKSCRWWEHKELFRDPVYGSYFVVLQRAGLRKICEIVNQPNSYRLVKGGFFPDFSKPESPKSVGIIPVLPSLCK